MACPCGIGAVPTASFQLTRRPRRYPRGSSIGTGGMLGDFSTHSSVGPPQPVPPDGGAVQQAADEFPPRLQRTLDLRLAPDQLAALVEIHRAVAGHLDRKALFTAIAQVLQRVVPVSRVILLLSDTDPSTLTVYAAYGKLGVVLPGPDDCSRWLDPGLGGRARKPVRFGPRRARSSALPGQL